MLNIFRKKNKSTNADIVDRPNPSKEFLQNRYQAMVHVNNNFKKFAGMAQNELEDFHWIKFDLTSPSFEDFTFAYRNQIFSVVVEKATRTDKGQFAFGNSQRIKTLLQVCEDNNLVPCIYPIIKKEGIPYYLGTWNLIHAATGKFADPTDLASDEPIEVSDWEFNNWAIQIVMNSIKEQGFQLLSYCDMPGIAPQIWFNNAEGKHCWIEVLPITPGGNKPDFSKECFPPQVLEHDGYAAEVSFAASETDRVSKIYRAKGADINFDGIKQIHVAR